MAYSFNLDLSHMTIQDGLEQFEGLIAIVRSPEPRSRLQDKGLIAYFLLVRDLNTLHFLAYSRKIYTLEPASRNTNL